MVRFIPRDLNELEIIPKGTCSKIRVMTGIRGGELLTSKVKTSVRAPNVTNADWGVTLGHVDQPVPHSNPAYRTARVASGAQMFLPKKDAVVADRHAQTVLSYGAHIASPFAGNPAENWFYNEVRPIFTGRQDLST